MDKSKLTKGTKIYYGGDMANQAKFGIIAAVTETQFGTSLDVIYDDGTTTKLQPGQFSEKYLVHGGTRFVTKAAYDAWQAEQIAAFKARYARA